PTGSVCRRHTSAAWLFGRAPPVFDTTVHVKHAVYVSGIEIRGAKHFGSHGAYNQYPKVKVTIAQQVGHPPVKIRVGIADHVEVVERGYLSILVNIAETHISGYRSRKRGIILQVGFILVDSLVHITDDHPDGVADPGDVSGVPLTALA